MQKKLNRHRYGLLFVFVLSFNILYSLNVLYDFIESTFYLERSFNDGNGVYKGQINDKRFFNGFGVYYWNNKNIYIGSWTEGKQNGIGIYILRDGNNFIKRIYVGQLTQGQRGLIGREYDKEGNLIFSGKYKNNNPDQATQNTKNIKFDVINYLDGSFYFGEIINGKRDELGLYVWADGTIFFGNWVDDNRFGNGYEMLIDGTVNVGLWNNNTFSNRQGSHESKNKVYNKNTNNDNSNTNTQLHKKYRSIEEATNEATNDLIKNIDKSAKLGVVGITSSEKAEADLVWGFLESLLTKKNYLLYDRLDIDKVKSEQMFQLSGDVDDNTIRDIGKFHGLDIIITGRITRSNNVDLLILRAIYVEEGRVITGIGKF